MKDVGATSRGPGLLTVGQQRVASKVSRNDHVLPGAGESGDAAGPGAAGGAMRSDYQGDSVTPARSRPQSARSGADDTAEEINDGVAGRRLSQTVIESNYPTDEIHSFSIQEGTAIGMPSVAEMLTETLSRPDDRTWLNRLLPCHRTSRREQKELSELFGGSLAAEGALRARTWHRYGALC